MQIEVHPEVLRLLEGDGVDIEKLMNDIACIYATGGFIRVADIVEKFTVDKVFRKRSDNLMPVFDAITQDFQGMAVAGKTDSETLWIASPRLHDAIEENEVLIVMKSPRKTGIRLRTGSDLEVPAIAKENFS